MKIIPSKYKLIKTWIIGPMKLNIWKCTNGRQISTKHTSRCVSKGKKIGENNDSSYTKEIT